MEKLYPHELRHIHDRMLDLYGGLSGEKDPGMIDYVCEKPFAMVFGHERHSDVFEKASVSMFYWQEDITSSMVKNVLQLWLLILF